MNLWDKTAPTLSSEVKWGHKTDLQVREGLLCFRHWEEWIHWFLKSKLSSVLRVYYKRPKIYPGFMNCTLPHLDEQLVPYEPLSHVSQLITRFYDKADSSFYVDSCPISALPHWLFSTAPCFSSSLSLFNTLHSLLTAHSRVGPCQAPYSSLDLPFNSPVEFPEPDTHQWV